MLENIRLGFKDIYRNKFIFILLQVLILLISIIYISTSLTMQYSSINTESNTLANLYHLVPVSNDMSNNKNLVNKIYHQIRDDNSMAYYYSSVLGLKNKIDVIVVFGNGALFSKSLPQSLNNTIAYSVNSKEIPDKIELNGKDYPTKALDIRDINNAELAENLTSPAIIVFANDENLDKWIHLEDGTEIIQMLGQVSLISLNEVAIRDILKDSYIYMTPYESNDDEIKFVLTYIYPILVFTVISVIIAFSIFNNHSLRKMKKEYTVHMLYGAKTSDILLRNSVIMIFSLIIDSACMTFLIQGESEPIVKTVYIIIIAILLLFEGTIIYQVKANHFMKNIRIEN